MARPVGNHLAQVEQLEQRLNHDRGQKTPLNLLELSESMASADEELAARFLSSLAPPLCHFRRARNSRCWRRRRRSAPCRSAHAIKPPQAGGRAQRIASSAGEAKAESELQRTRAVALEGQLQLLSSVQSSSPATHESPVVTAAVPQSTEKSDAASPKAPAPRHHHPP